MEVFCENLKFKSYTFKLSSKVICLHGPEAVQYLNSQTCNNLNSLEKGKFQFNSILEISGKLISSFLVCKDSDEKIFLILRDDVIDQTLERIERFHISEDFETEILEQNIYLKTNSKEGNFTGSYFFEHDSIHFESELDISDRSIFTQLKVLTGVPEFGVEAMPGELINNTRFDELTVDYKKGCYPGQETVSKIETRRGAAYKPVLIKTENQNKEFSDTKLKVDGKKAGTILNSTIINNELFLMAALGREYRIDNSVIEFEIEDKKYNGSVHYYPFIAVTDNDKAVELYDLAIECFHNGENDKAIKLFYRAIELNPLYEDAYESLGVLYGRLENYDKAIELMEKLKEINPQCMMALTNLSLYHMKLGNIEVAEKFKADATILNFTILGDEAERKKKEKEIKERQLAERDRREGMFQQVLEMDPEDAMANNGMGEIMLEKERFEVAVEFFKQAIKADKKYSVAYLGLGKSLLKSNKVNDALDILNDGVKVASKNGDLMPANEMQSLIQKYS